MIHIDVISTPEDPEAEQALQVAQSVAGGSSDVECRAMNPRERGDLAESDGSMEGPVVLVDGEVIARGVPDERELSEAIENRRVIEQRRG